jgi:rieske iron-sulfur protein
MNNVPLPQVPLSRARRTLLKLAFGLGLGLPFIEPARGQDTDPRKARPQRDDRFVFPSGTRDGQIVTLADVPKGGPPVTAYPIDLKTKIVRNDSRLNQVLLIRLDPADLADETRARSAQGVVAYSAVCSHTGCDVWDWQPETRTIKCPCHFSTFDVKDGARVLDGPAPRRLPALPLRMVDGVLAAAGGFVGRVGFQQGGSRLSSASRWRRARSCAPKPGSARSPMVADPKDELGQYGRGIRTQRVRVVALAVVLLLTATATVTAEDECGKVQEVLLRYGAVPRP